MKKIILFSFFALIGMLTFNNAHSQNNNNPERKIIVSADTSKDVDTVIVQIPGIGSNVKSFTVSVNRLSGNPNGGIVLLQGNNDGNWFDINTDTLIVTNKAVNTKMWPISRTNYYSYRAWYKSAGTQTSTISLTSFRVPKIQKEED